MQFLATIDRVVKASVDGETQELKEYAALLKCKYSPLAIEPQGGEGSLRQ